MKCYPCHQYYASIAFGMANKKTTIMQHFNTILLTGPIQNGGPAVSMVLKIWAWFWIVSIESYNSVLLSMRLATF